MATALRVIVSPDGFIVDNAKGVVYTFLVSLTVGSVPSVVYQIPAPGVSEVIITSTSILLAKEEVSTGIVSMSGEIN